MTNYIYDGTFQENMSFSTMVSAALSKQGGPRPICKQPTTVQVPQGEGVAVPFDGTAQRYVATPLLSCAAVIFASAESDAAYLYHATSGIVPTETIDVAILTLNLVPLKSIYVIYTFPKDSDDNYLGDASKIADFGIPAANIIYAPKLALPAFGITAQTILG